MRSITPELLDLLPADDPRAITSRRDLQRINFVIRQQAIMARSLSVCAQPRVLVDMGSGDGRFLLGVSKRLAKPWPGVRVLLADQQDIVSSKTREKFASFGWSCESLVGDVFDSLARLGSGADIITANLFLHHFDDIALAKLLAVVKESCRSFVACEPHRSLLALIGGKMVFALGCNGVTRHDTVASVRAGFRSKELSALWPQDGQWKLHESSAFPFSHVFTAVKHAG